MLYTCVICIKTAMMWSGSVCVTLICYTVEKLSLHSEELQHSYNNTRELLKTQS